ncbi:protein involved in gliding motility GldH [Polaribacter sp. Hel1_33_96]|jgi:gliding motility-associated lipoprotein GldH|nr:gliding motility lipoprotein GldH [Polaribacter sp.]MBT7816339.1 gliding motility lipoprotein GldH [Polaribacter sp.]PKV63790.1 protein involved in gliding motility GldH [Polaribacter sp. Hel1_33_96]
MEMILKKNRIFTFLIGLLFLFSCNDRIVFTKYKSLQNASWEANKNISIEFDVEDTITPKDLFINIRNNKKYPYSNLYVITELNFPNGNKIVDTLQYQMSDKFGHFLGKGFTDIKENKLFYKEAKVFPESGKYIFSIRHAMRKNGEVKVIPFLQGVQDVGLSIEKIE